MVRVHQTQNQGKATNHVLYTPVGIYGTADKATSHFVRGLPVTVVKWTIVQPPIYQSTLIIDLLILIIDLLMPIISNPPRDHVHPLLCDGLVFQVPRHSQPFRKWDIFGGIIATHRLHETERVEEVVLAIAEEIASENLAKTPKRCNEYDW